MNRPFLLDDALQARLTELAIREQQTEEQLLQEAVRDFTDQEDGRAGILVEARWQSLAVARCPNADADQTFVDAVSDWQHA